MLTVICGHSATGKTTISSALARAACASDLRVDPIVRSSPLSCPLRPVGYAVAQSLVLEQLRFGPHVVVECVNPVKASRDGWFSVASEAGVDEAVTTVQHAQTAQSRR